MIRLAQVSGITDQLDGQLGARRSRTTEAHPEVGRILNRYRATPKAYNAWRSARGYGEAGSATSPRSSSQGGHRTRRFQGPAGGAQARLARVRLRGPAQITAKWRQHSVCLHRFSFFLIVSALLLR